MDGGLLSIILLNFKAESEHWNIALMNLLEPSWFVFAKLALVLLMLGLVFDHGKFFGAILNGLLWLGFSHVLFLHSFEWSRDLSDGVRHLSGFLGVPAYDPSAVVGLGAYAAAPLFTSVGDGGYLSFLRHPTALFFTLSGIVVFLVFCLLAAVQFYFILVNYLLIATAPFFLLWLPLPGLNALSQKWISMGCGNLSGLFVTGLLTGMAKTSSRAMGEQYHAVFADATKTFTWLDYGAPLATALVLGAAFWKIPFRFSGEASSIASAMWAGGSMALGAASYGFTMPAKTGGGSQSGGTSNANGGSQQQISSSQGRDWDGGGFGGGSMGPAREPAKSQWS